MAAVPGLGWSRLPATFQLGCETLKVPMAMHKTARLKLVEEMKSRGVTCGVVLLEGGEQQNVYDTDCEIVFKPNSWFNYLFGTKESGLYGSIDIESGHTTLFIPELPEEYLVWCGEIFPPSHFKEMYDVDEVLYDHHLIDKLQKDLSSSSAKLHMLYGLNTDSGSYVEPVKLNSLRAFANKTDTSILHAALSKSRTIKSDLEMNIMWYCAYVASNAHVAVMKSTQSGMMEFELEATFQYNIYKYGGCRRCAYTSICACGPNNAVLHYGHAGAPNDRQLLPTDMALLDMGAEYHGYVSDITCSFPVSGKFTTDQKFIYQAVLNAQQAVYAIMRAGTSWVDCHRAAEVEILKGLQLAGVLKQDADPQAMLEAHLGATFMPHGLGHLIGCDTHDVGGYLDGETPPRPNKAPTVMGGVSKLRTARVLETGMVLTNEPGCYFIDALINEALSNPDKSKYINVERLEQYRHTGGVRLEDVIAVTEGNPVNYTTCPRTIEEVESVRSGGKWPPAQDKAPELFSKMGNIG